LGILTTGNKNSSRVEAMALNNSLEASWNGVCL
jgi:hypothetical protein